MHSEVECIAGLLNILITTKNFFLISSFFSFIKLVYSMQENYAKTGAIQYG